MRSDYNEELIEAIEKEYDCTNCVLSRYCHFQDGKEPSPNGCRAFEFKKGFEAAKETFSGEPYKMAAHIKELEVKIMDLSGKLLAIKYIIPTQIENLARDIRNLESVVNGNFNNLKDLNVRMKNVEDVVYKRRWWKLK